MTTTHIHVDETKERGYVIVASFCTPEAAAAIRKMLRGDYVLPGQSRIHMAKESDRRRRKIADLICQSNVAAVVYDAGRRYSDDLDARAECLLSIVRGLPANQQALLVIEQDDSIIRWDKRFLYNVLRSAGREHTVTYTHRRASADLVLSIPDAIAWCWARGGLWRERIRPAVNDVVRV